MEQPSDLGKLNRIYQAEREAGRIVAEAREAAQALVDEAAAQAAAALAEKRELLARRSRETLEAESRAIDREAQDFLEAARRQTDRWVARAEREIDPVVEALLDMVLPP